MADNSIPQYPFMFDPSQFSNQFSNFAGQALPFPPTYAGVPTNALGQPIASYQPPAATPGTTLNSTPAPAAQGGGAGMAAGGFADIYGQLANQQLASLGSLTRNGPQYGPGPYQNTMSNVNNDLSAQAMWARGGPEGFDDAGNQVTGPGGAPMSGGSGGGTVGGGGGGGTLNNWNAALAALSNPGHVTTPGATNVGTPPTILNQFLAGWKPSYYKAQGFGGGLPNAPAQGGS